MHREMPVEPALRRKFDDEKRALIRLSARHHPGVADIYDSGESPDETPFPVMQEVEFVGQGCFVLEPAGEVVHGEDAAGAGTDAVGAGGPAHCGCAGCGRGVVVGCLPKGGAAFTDRV